MRPYPLRKNITREEFEMLVTDLYYRLAAKGLNPDSNLAIEEKKLVSPDGKTYLHFALLISEAAAQILENEPN